MTKDAGLGIVGVRDASVAQVVTLSKRAAAAGAGATDATYEEEAVKVWTYAATLLRNVAWPHVFHCLNVVVN